MTQPQMLQAAAEGICRLSCSFATCCQQNKCTHGNLQNTMFWQEAEAAVTAYEAASATARQEARREALEEAATLAEDFSHGQFAANAIRALASQEETDQKETPHDR